MWTPAIFSITVVNYLPWILVGQETTLCLLTVCTLLANVFHVNIFLFTDPDYGQAAASLLVEVEN